MDRWKEKRKLEQMSFKANMESIDSAAVWSEMLEAKSMITVLEATSDEELTQKWTTFYTEINKGDGRLGSLWALDDKQFSVNEGTFYLMVQYRQFCLREGAHQQEYEQAIAESERMKAHAEELQAKVKAYRIV